MVDVFNIALSSRRACIFPDRRDVAIDRPGFHRDDTLQAFDATIQQPLREVSPVVGNENHPFDDELGEIDGRQKANCRARWRRDQALDRSQRSSPSDEPS